ncbi:hypothetical protein GCM10009754_80200 [Amycolatopsis minnesotensis]|uniref:SEFIR domain-containing protein n=1 Tax=Amycolatopsis minnesotensis TaxID=337894 RepID=A0ABN2SNQ4_9PSEU
MFVTYARDSPEHQKLVQRFAEFLRTRMGLDMRFDQWYENKRRDWSLWALEHLTAAEFILVIASPEYRRRADGAALPGEGRRAQFEAAMLRDDLVEDLHRATERILPVILPGQTIEGIPGFLNAHSTTSFRIDAFTEGGVSELMAAITGRGRFPLPERGPWTGTTGATGAAANGSVLLANGLPWLASSTEIRSGRARIDGVQYADSVLVRPSGTAEIVSFVEIDLGAAYRRMTSVVGVLDDAAEPFQIGHFRVRLDGRPRSEYRAALGKPRLVDVDVTGALKLRLEMYRPGTRTSPGGTRPTGTGVRSSNLPELAWGDPALS